MRLSLGDIGDGVGDLGVIYCNAIYHIYFSPILSKSSFLSLLKKKRFPSHSEKIYELRLKCLLVSYSIILSHFNKTHLTNLNLRAKIGNSIFYIMSKVKDNDEISSWNDDLFKLEGLFIDIFTLFPNNVFDEEYNEKGNTTLGVDPYT